MTSRWIAVAVLCSLFSGCAVRVDPLPHIPATPPPADFRGRGSIPTAGDATALADLKWFEVFKDEQLQQLIRTALLRNYDVRDAVARVQAAFANLGITRADQLPSAGVATDLTSLRFSRGGNFPVPEGFSQNRTFGTVALNLLSYEVDVWGRLRRATDGAHAEVLASQEDRRAVATTLVSNVAAAYFNLLALDAELEIAKRTLLTREESLHVIKTRERRGLATTLEVRQGEQLVHGAAQTIPEIQRQIEQTENEISLLIGANPGPISRGRPLTEQEQPPDVPPGLPSELLARRPDIRAAEQRLTSVDAMVDVAKAAYFPRIALTAYFGSQSDQLLSLFSGPTGIWQFAGQVSQPIFSGGRIRSDFQMAKAQQQLALVQYQRVIQTAFTEVSDALVQYRRVREIREKQENLLATLQDRSRLSYVRYRGGVATLLDALDADRDLFEAELRLTQTKRNELLAVVQLYAALGGGWQQ